MEDGLASRTPGSRSGATRKAALDRLVGRLGGDRVCTLGALFREADVPLERATVVALSRKASVFARNVSTLGEDDLASLYVSARESARQALRDDGLLLDVLSRKAAGGEMRAHTLAQLSDMVSPRDKAAFRQELEARDEARRWPAGVGTLRGLGSTLVFRMEDVLGTSGAPVTNGNGHAPDFSRAFGEAFDKLRQERRVNLVALSSLRQALPGYPRETFDRELYELRRANQFVLETSESRHGKPRPEELEGGIEEGGRRFVYASRRDHA
jgi:hypothetical protein